ncbi:MAG: DUF1016 N-terminal domain-containing protein [Gallionella sp.]|nr:DUF1016 N-terminal domain-containing protein [Gallionella sp.]
MTIPLNPQDDFNEITQLIHAARQRAVQAVNTALIELYWQVGQFISRKIEQAEWGDGVVAQLAEHLARTQPGLRGFTSRNLFERYGVSIAIVLDLIEGSLRQFDIRKTT